MAKEFKKKEKQPVDTPTDELEIEVSEPSIKIRKVTVKKLLHDIARAEKHIANEIIRRDIAIDLLAEIDAQTALGISVTDIPKKKTLKQ